MKHTSRTSRLHSFMHSDRAAFIGLVVCVVVGLWFIDAVVQAASAPAPVSQTPERPAVSDDVFPFSIAMLHALSGYYVAMNDTTSDPKNNINLFASLVYRRNLLQKIDQSMAVYESSNDTDVSHATRKIVSAGEALVDSYSKIIDSIKAKDQEKTSYVVIEEMYHINDQLFNLTMTSVNTLATFMGTDGTAAVKLNPAQQTYIRGYIADTFGTPDSLMGSSSPSRAYLLQALGASTR